MERRYFNLVDIRTGEPLASYCVDAGVEFIYDRAAGVWRERPGGEVSSMFNLGDPELDLVPFEDTIAPIEAPALNPA